ncbi:hypothetical protein HDU98_000521 [Podochytrium sp. JEL0797]|nr:hypothetical protein HDU98_000521 [Podochytrium sp. JEL0797]
MSIKPSVLLLGGVGSIGRNFVSYLLDSDLVSLVRVSDRTLPATAYLNAKQKKDFEDARVEFVQANLSNAASLAKVFTKGDGSSEFDYVFNLAGESKYSLADEVYKERIVTLSTQIGAEAAKRKIKGFMQLSTGQVYAYDKKPANEQAKLKPWTNVAKFKLQAEEDLKAIDGLNLVIIRIAAFYGLGDVSSISYVSLPCFFDVARVLTRLCLVPLIFAITTAPRIIMGAVYRQLKEPMNLLWTKDLKINTVHLSDVVRGMWAATVLQADGGSRQNPIQKGGEVYNLCDKSDSDQGSINDVIKAIFGIETGFQGTIISQFAKLNLASITEDVNDKHLEPWGQLCKDGGIHSTPLTPFLDVELLRDNALNMDGSLIEKTFGFQYSVPSFNESKVRELIADFEAIGVWPKGTMK